MTLELLMAMLVFTIAASVTPGPNNMMLMASGMNFGLRRTLPHILGVVLGFLLMQALIGLGLGQVFALYPAFYQALKIVGALYMLWLAWKIANSGPASDTAESGRPLTFVQAAAFQWVNPKAWAMIIGAMAAYTVPDAYLMSLAALMIAFVLVGSVATVAWATFGVGMRRLLRDPARVRAFNIGMALLLVASLWPIAAELVWR